MERVGREGEKREGVRGEEEGRLRGREGGREAGRAEERQRGKEGEMKAPLPLPQLTHTHTRTHTHTHTHPHSRTPIREPHPHPYIRTHKCGRGPPSGPAAQLPPFRARRAALPRPARRTGGTPPPFPPRAGPYPAAVQPLVKPARPDLAGPPREGSPGAEAAPLRGATELEGPEGRELGGRAGGGTRATELGIYCS